MYVLQLASACNQQAGVQLNVTYNCQHAGKRICISGGGIGGSAFALALEQACKLSNIVPRPSIKVFERDPSISTQENLGWSFGLKSEEGSGGLQVHAASFLPSLPLLSVSAGLHLGPAIICRL